jgi:hypothetical protein
MILIGLFVKMIENLPWAIVCLRGKKFGVMEKQETSSYV